MAGVALITVAVLAPVAGFSAAAGGFTATGAGVTATGAATFAGAAAAFAGNIGIGLVFLGIAQSISPQPNLDRTIDESVQLESFSFSNVVNTSKQGLPVPIAYGRVFVGSAIISSGLDVDEVSA